MFCLSPAQKHCAPVDVAYYTGYFRTILQLRLNHVQCVINCFKLMSCTIQKTNRTIFLQKQFLISILHLRGFFEMMVTIFMT